MDSGLFEATYALTDKKQLTKNDLLYTALSWKLVELFKDKAKINTLPPGFSIRSNHRGSGTKDGLIDTLVKHHICGTHDIADVIELSTREHTLLHNEIRKLFVNKINDRNVEIDNIFNKFLQTYNKPLVTYTDFGYRLESYETALKEIALVIHDLISDQAFIDILYKEALDNLVSAGKIDINIKENKNMNKCLKESNTEIKNLIKKRPTATVQPAAKPQVSVDINDYACPKVKCVKCSADCLDGSHAYGLDIPTELRAWDTVFGWYCDKCHDAQSDYEWNLEGFCLACDDSNIIRDHLLYEDNGIDRLVDMIDSWNRAKKDPRFILTSKITRMEQNFISNAEKCDLDINPGVFALDAVSSADLDESRRCDWKARAKSFLDNDLFIDFDDPK